MNDKELKKYQVDLERASRLDNLVMIDDWSIVNELIDELITAHVNGALSDACKDDHNEYLYHKAAIDGLKELKAKFVTVQRLGKQASQSMEAINGQK